MPNGQKNHYYAFVTGVVVGAVVAVAVAAVVG